MRTHTSSASSLILKAAVLLALIFCLPLAAFARRAVPENLGNGLDKLVESNLAIKAGAPATFNGFATAQAAMYGKMAIVDKATGHPRRTVFRAIGPELKSFGVPTALDDTTLEVRDVNGTVIGSNDNWKDASNAAELNTTGLAPNIDAESAVLITFGPGKYTSIVRGANNTPG